MLLESLLALGIVATFVGYVLFSIHYVPERPPSQGWDE